MYAGPHASWTANIKECNIGSGYKRFTDNDDARGYRKQFQRNSTCEREPQPDHPSPIDCYVDMRSIPTSDDCWYNPKDTDDVTMNLDGGDWVRLEVYWGIAMLCWCFGPPIASVILGFIMAGLCCVCCGPCCVPLMCGDDFWVANNFDIVIGSKRVEERRRREAEIYSKQTKSNEVVSRAVEDEEL